uniref:Uncharacterized protein n=1 Tax=Arundo donax TaxID=35708 RepID=A0A0A8YGY6_ARUDO
MVFPELNYTKSHLALVTKLRRKVVMRCQGWHQIESISDDCDEGGPRPAADRYRPVNNATC